MKHTRAGAVVLAFSGAVAAVCAATSHNFFEKEVFALFGVVLFGLGLILNELAKWRRM